MFRTILGKWRTQDAAGWDVRRDDHGRIADTEAIEVKPSG